MTGWTLGAHRCEASPNALRPLNHIERRSFSNKFGLLLNRR